MTDQEFSEIKKYIEEKLTLCDDESHIVVITKNLPSIYQVVLDVFTKELKILSNLKLRRDKKYGELTKFYKEDYERTLTKEEIRSYCCSDSEYYDMCYEVERTEIIVKYFELTLGNIKRMSYDIKNWIDIKKFLSGC